MADQPPSQPTQPDHAHFEPGRIERWRERTKQAKSRGLTRLEAERAKRVSVRLAFDLYERDRAFAGGLLAGGIAFRLFLWFLPFALLMIVLIGSLADGLDRPASELAQDSGLSVALAGLVDQAVGESARGRVYLGFLGAVLLIWSGIAVARSLRLVSRLAWGLASVRPMKAVKASLAVAGIMLGVLGVQWVNNRLQGGPLAADAVAFIVAILALVALMTWLLSALPRPPDVPWTAMIPGAILMTAGLVILRLLTIVYFAGRLESADDLYGGLGLAAVFLAWLYIIGRTLVASISLNPTLWRAHRTSMKAP